MGSVNFSPYKKFDYKNKDANSVAFRTGLKSSLLLLSLIFVDIFNVALSDQQQLLSLRTVQFLCIGSREGLSFESTKISFNLFSNIYQLQNPTKNI